MSAYREGSATGGGTAGTGNVEATPDGTGRAKPGQGQGDDLADRLGGTNSHAGLTGGAGSGNLEAGRSMPAAPDPGAGDNADDPTDPANRPTGVPGAETNGLEGMVGGAGRGTAEVGGRTPSPRGGDSPLQGAEAESEAHPS